MTACWWDCCSMNLLSLFLRNRLCRFHMSLYEKQMYQTYQRLVVCRKRCFHRHAQGWSLHQGGKMAAQSLLHHPDRYVPAELSLQDHSPQGSSDDPIRSARCLCCQERVVRHLSHCSHNNHMHYAVHHCSCLCEKLMHQDCCPADRQ